MLQWLPITPRIKSNFLSWPVRSSRTWSLLTFLSTPVTALSFTGYTSVTLVFSFSFNTKKVFLPLGLCIYCFPLPGIFSLQLAPWRACTFPTDASSNAIFIKHILGHLLKSYTSNYLICFLHKLHFITEPYFFPLRYFSQSKLSF